MGPNFGLKFAWKKITKVCIPRAFVAHHWLTKISIGYKITATKNVAGQKDWTDDPWTDRATLLPSHGHGEIVYREFNFLSTVKPGLAVTSIKQPTCLKQPNKMFPNFNFVLIFTSIKKPPNGSTKSGCLTQVWPYTWRCRWPPRTAALNTGLTVYLEVSLATTDCSA